MKAVFAVILVMSAPLVALGSINGYQDQAGIDPPLVVGADWFATMNVPPAFFWGSTGIDGPFTFTSSGPVNVFITDDFNSGDRFEIFDFGVSLGLTSVPTLNDTVEIGPALAYMDPDYSHGVFLVGAGSHSITINIVDNPFGQGRAYIKAEAAAVPEPSTVLIWSLLGAVGIAAAWYRRARKTA